MCWASGDGVSPSVAWPDATGRGEIRRDAAGLGWAWHGDARHGLRWQHGEPSGFPCRLHWWTWQGPDGSSRAASGGAWPGPVRHGKSHRRWHGELRLSLPLSQGWTRQGSARRGTAGFGMARHGMAGHGLQTAALGASAPTAALFGGQTRQGLARHGAVRRAWARHGVAWTGKARQGLTISARRAQVLPAGFTQHT
jgi:hypothetical protein